MWKEGVKQRGAEEPESSESGQRCATAAPPRTSFGAHMLTALLLALLAANKLTALLLTSLGGGAREQ